ncbi:ADP-ribose pyrophosphatase YjhB, NUDIX family [Rhodonellum ikkaensis]|uniref:ADP-ribose pyrophosphatase YjhB, NUDIX family n=2 Tax=Cytophagaceae TaxID=89373 RepID=A0A1H3K7W2_9BACT|nr:ADP-ribose pyrophosphatase YjhB, NUDIX family [Rhodonellum ikkaensis]
MRIIPTYLATIYNPEQKMSLPLENDFIPHLAFDSVIFGFSGEKLKILLMEYHNTAWLALPGGFVGKNENLNDAVRRGLQERTGLDKIYLEQFYTFGDLARFKPEIMQTILAANGHQVAAENWMLDRFVSVAYYALINYHEVEPKPDALSDSIAWYDVDALPELILDHSEIVKKALETLKSNIDRKLVSMNLLPPRFTIKELQQVYEAILGEKLRRTTFQRKILSLDILERHEKLYSGKSHKAPFLYSFKGNQMGN